MLETEKRFSDPLLGVYCCGHIFRRERPIKLIVRQEGDWQFLCGGADHHDPKEPYHVSLGVMLEYDSSLHELADLPAEWEAEREGPHKPWVRTKLNKSGSENNSH